MALWIPPKDMSLSGVHVGMLPEIQQSIGNVNPAFGTTLSSGDMVQGLTSISDGVVSACPKGATCPSDHDFTASRRVKEEC